MHYWMESTWRWTKTRERVAMNAMHIEGGGGRRRGGNVSMARYERLPTEGAWNDEMGLKWLLKRHGYPFFSICRGNALVPVLINRCHGAHSAHSFSRLSPFPAPFYSSRIASNPSTRNYRNFHAVVNQRANKLYQRKFNSKSWEARILSIYIYIFSARFRFSFVSNGKRKCNRIIAKLALIKLRNQREMKGWQRRRSINKNATQKKKKNKKNIKCISL